MGGAASCSSSKGYVAAAKVSDFDQKNCMKECTVADNKILIVKNKGKFYGIGANCTHVGAPLVNGSVGDGFVRCPWHGACFSLATGDIEQHPGFDSLPTYVTKVKGNTVYIDPTDIVRTSVVRPMTRKLKANPVFVIIGSGASAVMCAQTLRQNKFDGRIVLITKDANYPYDRTKLSKAPGSKWEAIKLRDKEFYESYDIEFMLDSAVTKIAFSDRTVHTGADGKNQISYDKLAICSGLRPRSYGKTVPGGDLKNVVTLYDLNNANKIAEMAKDKEVLICGSSFIAMELATALKDTAKRIDVIGRSRAPYGIVLGPATGKAILAHLLNSQNGDRVRYWGIDEVKSLVGNDKGEVTKALTVKKKAFDTQLVILAIGAIPNTEFLEDSPVRLNGQDGAICVNKFLETNVSGVYAAGDVTQFPTEFSAKGRASICHWGIATHHGKVAGLNMMGKQETVDQIVPFFWTNVAGVNVRYAGYGEGHSDTAIFGDPDAMEFCTLYRRANKALGVATVGCDPLAAEMANQFQSGVEYKHDYPMAILKRFPKPPIVGEKYYGFKEDDTKVYSFQELQNFLGKKRHSDHDLEKGMRKSDSRIYLID